ncbi:MAG TPA: carboxymuconolactone decarboxylase family protein [Jatrophihabitans sp.]|nr:carboxymuconolactone decarboxylase family protein [Jatrophihabitans sp.]
MTTVRGPRLPVPADGASYKTLAPQLSDALMRLQAAVIRDCALDPVTMELVRIRCAHVHDCRVCSHVRLRPAAAAGVDEDLLAQVDHYETSALSDKHKVALRLADAHLFGSPPASLQSQVQAELTQAEALDIVLLVVKCSYQKSLVALGLDAPGTYTWFEFDPETGGNVPLG